MLENAALMPCGLTVGVRIVADFKAYHLIYH